MLNINYWNSSPLSHREQLLMNLLQEKDYVKAVGVAIALDQPNRALNALTGERREGERWWKKYMYILNFYFF